MAQLSLDRLRFHRPSRAQWITGGATIVAIAAYLFVLRALDHRAERYFQDLRGTDPVTYLNQLREAKGFAAYLPEYAQLENFADYRPQPPSFLVGRWTMQDAPLRLASGQAPQTCQDPVTFDFGLFLTVEAGGVALPVQYRLSDDTVEMRSGESLVVPIRLVSYGAQLDHVEFTPPGRDAPVFAYLCGR